MTIAVFKKKVLQHYQRAGRSFPWRLTRNPYLILVSEVMLQQTQTDRVVPKFKAFVRAFPTPVALAAAPLPRVLSLWQGLGYNRRALFLQRAAQAIVGEHGGVFPTTLGELERLPGVGPYTAAAICAFAYNQRVVFIETNIRAALIHEFFPRARSVQDVKLLPILKKCIAAGDPHTWYQALMDYGAHIKQVHTNPSRHSAQYSRQSLFAGSVRQARGQILRDLLRTKQYSVAKHAVRARQGARQKEAMSGLIRDGLVAKKGRFFILKEL